MARRTALLAALGAGLLAATPAAGDNSAKIAALHARIAAARQKESALSSQVSSITAQIRSLEGKVGDVSQRLSLLERDLALHRERLAKLSALFTLETNRLHFLQRQYARSVTLLNRRVVQIYEEPSATVADVILSAKSVQDAIDTLHYLTSIAQLDNKIAHAVRAARDEVDVAREKTKKARTVVASETQVVAIRTQQQREVKDRLLASEHKLSGLRGSKRQALASTKQQEQDLIAEADALAAADARIRSQLAAAQSHSSSATDTTPSSSGLIWPVSGPVISPFGMRWGRLHAGIDIAVPSGTPIHAAAAGTVVIAGWVGGYGNYTCIDHGGGLATCYAHQQSFAVGVGAHVAQGQVIGYTDCTGHCLGPHLHFEVRINGTPVDPLGYL
ncbi:MAG TPA: peptidoglycan DD-metalloendopeptidase family protein [Gaiellaceae bacterium]|nr:peptidoglycan DD-metalloendopeptidase family protein [Gaiellaceae bacterium]